MTAGVRGWLAGAAAIMATLVPCRAEAKPCATDFDCLMGDPQTPICAGFVCVACTSNLQCFGPGTAGPNCDLMGPKTMGTCFNCTAMNNGPVCPPSAPVCEPLGGLCVPGTAPDAGSPDAAPASNAGDSGGGPDADAGQPAGDSSAGPGDASPGPGDAASDTQSATDAPSPTGDGSSTPGDDYGSPGLIEGGACSCDLPGDSRAGLGAGGLAFALTLLAWWSLRRSTT
jgi:hypothetical protein